MTLATATRFAKFAFVGGFALLLKLAITYLLTEYLALWYFLSFLIATFFAWSAIFFANSIFTFAGHSKERYWKRYTTFMLGYLSMFWVNALIVLILTSAFNVLYLLSIIIAAVATSAFTFIFNTRYVYQD